MSCSNFRDDIRAGNLQLKIPNSRLVPFDNVFPLDSSMKTLNRSTIFDRPRDTRATAPGCVHNSTGREAHRHRSETADHTTIHKGLGTCSDRCARLNSLPNARFEPRGTAT